MCVCDSVCVCVCVWQCVQVQTVVAATLREWNLRPQIPGRKRRGWGWFMGFTELHHMPTTNLHIHTYTDNKGLLTSGSGSSKIPWILDKRGTNTATWVWSMACLSYPSTRALSLILGALLFLFAFKLCNMFLKTLLSSNSLCYVPAQSLKSLRRRCLNSIKASFSPS